MQNMLNKIIVENFPNLKKVMSVQVQEVCRTQNRLDENRNSLQHITIEKKLAQRTRKEF
jgi:ribosomal protein L5